MLLQGGYFSLCLFNFFFFALSFAKCIRIQASNWFFFFRVLFKDNINNFSSVNILNQSTKGLTGVDFVNVYLF